MLTRGAFFATPLRLMLPPPAACRHFHAAILRCCHDY